MFRIFLIFAVSLISSATFSQIALKRVLINNILQKNPTNGIIQLKATENDLIIEFSQIKEDSVEYLYRLLGNDIDSAWVMSAYPVVHFQDFQEGDFVFQIKSSNKKLPVKTLKISREIPFYYTTWFKFSIVIYFMILIGVGIYLLFLYDFRQKLRLQGVRNQIAADLHDEVGSNLNSIAIFVEVLRKKATPDILPILDKIIDNSKESITLMQDTIWTINPKNDSVEKLFERMRSFAYQILASSDVALDFEIKADLKKVNFTMEQRKNIYLIFKEAINNIVKHAYASKAGVIINKTDDKLQITIEDNGKGFDINSDFGGNGLHNFKTRAEEAEIEFNISSKIGLGTKIEVVAFVN